jgi:hypothetical protein
VYRRVTTTMSEKISMLGKGWSGGGFVGDRYQKDEEAGVSGRNGPFGLWIRR